MKWLVLSSAVLSCLSNMFSMIGYECIALAGENYKLRRRCIRFGGFLIFLSGTFITTVTHGPDKLIPKPTGWGQWIPGSPGGDI